MQKRDKNQSDSKSQKDSSQSSIHIEEIWSTSEAKVVIDQSSFKYESLIDKLYKINNLSKSMYASIINLKVG